MDNNMSVTRRIVPRASVGLPVFNGERYLEESLGSMRAQHYDDFEIVICDNASTDRTEEICRDLAADDERVIYHRQSTNRGAGFNYNDCFQRSRGEFFTWLAHDDLRAPAFLAKCVSVFDSAPGSVVLVYPKALFIDADGEVIGPDDYGVADRSTAPHRRLRAVVTDRGAVNPLFGLIRASALDKTRLIGSFTASDRVLLAELALLGEIREVPERLIHRRLHDQMSTEANPGNAERQRWFDPGARAPVLPRVPRLVLEYSRSTLRLPMSATERAACLVTIPMAMGLKGTRVTLGRWRRDLQDRRGDRFGTG